MAFEQLVEQWFSQWQQWFDRQGSHRSDRRVDVSSPEASSTVTHTGSISVDVGADAHPPTPTSALTDDAVVQLLARLDRLQQALSRQRAALDQLLGEQYQQRQLLESWADRDPTARFG